MNDWLARNSETSYCNLELTKTRMKSGSVCRQTVVPPGTILSQVGVQLSHPGRFFSAPFSHLPTCLMHHTVMVTMIEERWHFVSLCSLSPLLCVWPGRIHDHARSFWGVGERQLE